MVMVVTREFARSRVEQQGLQAREVPADNFQAITRKGRRSRRARETRKVLSTTTLTDSPTLVWSRLLQWYQWSQALDDMRTWSEKREACCECWKEFGWMLSCSRKKWLYFFKVKSVNMVSRLLQNRGNSMEMGLTFWKWAWMVSPIAMCGLNCIWILPGYFMWISMAMPEWSWFMVVTCDAL